MQYKDKEYQSMKNLLRNALIMSGLSFASISFAANVATVNGKNITEHDFKTALSFLGPSASMVATNPQMRERFLQHLIESRLLSDEATKQKLASSAEFKNRLNHSKQQILAEMFIEQYIAKKTNDAAAKKYFMDNKKMFQKDEVKAAHILIKKDEAKAKKILKEAMKKGTNFAELAKKNSEGPSGPNGGELGWFGRGRMVPEFDKAAFATKKGEIYPKLVKTQFGWHIIKVIDVKKPSATKFADIKDEVKKAMSKNLRSELIEKLKKKAKVTTNMDNLKKMKL